MTRQQKICSHFCAVSVLMLRRRIGAQIMSFTRHCATVSSGLIKEVETVRKVKTISISLPLDVLVLVDHAAKETGLTRSSFISWALSINEQVKEARKNGTL